jgi:hypothetical protein
MLAMAVIGTYLAIGSLIALFAWSKSDKTEWLSDNVLITGLTFLRVMVFWPGVFVVFAKIVQRHKSKQR